MHGVVEYRHPTKDETFVMFRGKERVSTCNYEGYAIENVVLCPKYGKYGVDIPKNVWNSLESLSLSGGLYEEKTVRLLLMWWMGY